MTHDDAPKHPARPSPEPTGRWVDRHRLIDRREAEALGLSRRYLELAALTGDGPPFIKLGRAVRYRVGDLLDFIEAHRFTSTTEASSVTAMRKGGRHA